MANNSKRKTQWVTIGENMSFVYNIAYALNTNTYNLNATIITQWKTYPDSRVWEETGKGKKEKDQKVSAGGVNKTDSLVSIPSAVRRERNRYLESAMRDEWRCTAAPSPLRRKPEGHDGEDIFCILSAEVIKSRAIRPPSSQTLSRSSWATPEFTAITFGGR